MEASYPPLRLRLRLLPVECAEFALALDPEKMALTCEPPLLKDCLILFFFLPDPVPPAEDDLASLADSAISRTRSAGRPGFLAAIFAISLAIRTCASSSDISLSASESVPWNAATTSAACSGGGMASASPFMCA